MNKERELLKRARNMIDYRYATSEAIALTKEITELLAQPEQEPVAWIWEQQNPHSGEWDSEFAEGKPQNFRVVRNIHPLYTSPQKREPLSDEQIEAAREGNTITVHAFARAIEKAHGITGVDDE